MLARYKKGRAMLLTTHFMDEGRFALGQRCHHGRGTAAMLGHLPQPEAALQPWVRFTNLLHTLTSQPNKHEAVPSESLLLQIRDPAFAVSASPVLLLTRYKPDLLIVQGELSD